MPSHTLTVSHADRHDLDAGAVIITGFDGHTLPPNCAERLARGTLGGLIAFKRNLRDPFQARELGAAIAAITTDTLFCLDQEGGRVQRLRAPFIELPPMRTLGSRASTALTTLAAQTLAVELRAVGVNFNLAPVCDVDSNPLNPVIGDRAFGTDPHTVITHATAFIHGLQSRGVLACAKHFPGHGDTDVDSHNTLPVLPHDRARLDRIELSPFVAAINAHVAAVMTAHVRFDALDPTVPATLSSTVITKLFKQELCATIATPPLVVSDDLLMRAVSDRWSVSDAAIKAITAGCDLVLVCSDPELSALAHGALSTESRRSAAFASRLSDAATRVRLTRSRARLTPDPDRDSLCARFEHPNRSELTAMLNAETLPSELFDPTERPS